jgi:signal transduction histidine kinase
MYKKNSYTIFIILCIAFLIGLYSLLGISIRSIIVGLIFLFISILFFVIFRSYFEDIKKVDELNDKLSAGDYIFSPVFSNNSLSNLEKNIKIIEKKLSFQRDNISSIDKMKEDFIYLVSHNLRTPVVTLFGYFEILKSSTNLSSEDKNLLLRIDTSLDSLNSIIEQILSIMYLDSPDFKLNIETFEVNNFLKTIVENKIRNTNISVGFSFSENKQNITIDKSLLEKSLINIVGNAIKFNKEGGLISVSSYNEDKYVVIKISDTGIGIPQKNLDDIFKPFVRKTSVLNYDYEGLGLGLYTTNIIMEKLGGKLKVESIENKGSDFFLYIPF